MVTGENDEKEEGKGFAGLSSLVSDVDTSPPAAKKEPAIATPSAACQAQQSAQPQPQSPEAASNTYQEHPQPSFWSSEGKGLLGIAAVIGVLWLIGQSHKSTTSPVVAHTPPAQSAAPSYTPPAQLQAPSRPVETMPPVGQNLVFSREQIRYCLAEDIRLGAAKSAVNNYIDADVDRFNAMVADYNNRCSSFQYQTNNRGRNDLNSAQRDIEPFRSQLQSEGGKRFADLSLGQSSTSINGTQIIAPNLGSMTYKTSFDCTKAKSIPENLICSDPFLAEKDRELFIIFELARTAVVDKSEFRQRAKSQWNHREKNCKDRSCLVAWYEYQKSILTKIAQTGDVNARID